MSLGAFGEDVAVAFLRRRGARIVDRNLRCGRGEIDILALIDGHRVAVEVKSGLRSSGIDPVENLDDRKLRALWDAAATLRPPVWRIDLISVVFDADGADVRWLRDVA